jgi:tetratricopeptide (TPR) repeat protein
MTFIKKLDETPRFQPQIQPISTGPLQNTSAQEALTPEVQSASPMPVEAPQDTDNASIQSEKARTYTFSEEDLRFGSMTRTTALSNVQTPQAETEDPASLEAAAMLAAEGSQAFQAGDLESATLFYEASFEYDAKSAVLAYNLGVCYQKTGEEEKSSELFQTALALDPLNVELQQRILKQHIETRKF